MDKNAGDDDYSALVDTILRDDKKRVAFLKAMLIKLGLNVNEDISAVPTLSKLHLTAIYPEDVGHLQTNLKEIITKEGESELIVGENDTFVLEKSQGLSLWSSSKALEEPAQEDKIIDYDKIRKHICLHDRGYPPKEDTPYFNHDLYFHSLKKYRAQSRSSASQFGSFILYGEVLTSTNTILDK